MSYRTQQRILLAKEESEYGTDPTPTVASNAIAARNIKVEYVGDVLERNLQKEDLSPDVPKIGQRYIKISFECELKGSGSKGTAPAIGDLLEACGLAETVDAGSSVSYAPTSSGHKSITIYVYDVQTASSGKYRLHKATGARGSVNFKMEAGQIAIAEFSFEGIYNAMTDVSDPGNATYESTVPAIVESASFELNSSSDLIAQAINIDLANELVKNDDINSSGGIKRLTITGRKPNGTFNPEAVLAATYDFLGDWVAATSRALSVGVGSTAGNIVTITAPAVSIDAVTLGDRSGILVEDIPFRLNRSSGNDEININFT